MLYLHSFYAIFLSPPHEKLAYCPSLFSNAYIAKRNATERICWLKYVKASSERRFAYSTLQRHTLSDRNETFAAAYFRRGNDLEVWNWLDLEVEEMEIFRRQNIAPRSSRAKREFDIYRNRFRDLKLIVQVMATRVINYQSIIHRVLTVNYDPKEWARNVWCLRKLELDTELYFSNTIIPLPFSPLFSKHRTCHITRIRKQEFDSLFCFGNPRIYSTHF